MLPKNQNEVMGSLIKEARLKKKMTQLALSEQTQISRNFISEIETGKHAPSVGTLLRLATVLGIDLNKILKN